MPQMPPPKLTMNKIGFCLIALAACLVVGCGFLLQEGQPSTGARNLVLVNLNAPQGEPIGRTPTEEGVVYEADFDAPSTGYAQQKAARLEEILLLYDEVALASVTWDDAGQQVQVTVSTQAPLTAEQEEAIRPVAAAVFPEALIQLDRIQAV